MFFDDNIKVSSRCMIDVWDIGSKKRIQLNKSFGKELLKVDSVRAIKENDYFINLFTKCLGQDIKDPVNND